MKKNKRILLTPVLVCLTDTYRMKTTPEESITIRVPQALKKQLRDLAAEKDLTVSQLIRQTLLSRPARKPRALSKAS